MSLEGKTANGRIKINKAKKGACFSITGCGLSEGDRVGDEISELSIDHCAADYFKFVYVLRAENKRNVDLYLRNILSTKFTSYSRVKNYFRQSYEAV
jgi:hypothetical protein